jgi:hypothetical protein
MSTRCSTQPFVFAARLRGGARAALFAFWQALRKPTLVEGERYLSRASDFADLKRRMGDLDEADRSRGLLRP